MAIVKGSTYKKGGITFARTTTGKLVRVDKPTRRVGIAVATPGKKRKGKAAQKLTKEQLEATQPKTIAIAVGKEDGKTVVKDVEPYVGKEGVRELAGLTGTYGRLGVGDFKETTTEEGTTRSVRVYTREADPKVPDEQPTTTPIDPFQPSMSQDNSIYAPVQTDLKGQGTTPYVPETEIPVVIRRPEINIDSQRVFANLPPIEERRADLSVDVQTLKGLGKIKKITPQTVDEFERTLQKTGAKTYQFRMADTTTEMFRGIPEASQKAYDIYSSTFAAEQSLQKFYEKQDLKTIAIGAGSVLAAPVAGAVVGAAGIGAGVGAVGTQVIGRTLQIGYAASVGYRGYKTVKEFDPLKPTETILKGRNILAEVGGFAVGSQAVKGLRTAALTKKYKGALVSDFQRARGIEPSLGKVKIEYMPDIIVKGQELKGFAYATRTTSTGKITYSEGVFKPTLGKLKPIDITKPQPSSFLEVRTGAKQLMVTPRGGTPGVIPSQTIGGVTTTQRVVSPSKLVKEELIFKQLSFTKQLPVGTQFREFGIVTYGKPPKVPTTGKPSLKITKQTAMVPYAPKQLTLQTAKPFKFEIETSLYKKVIRVDPETGLQVTQTTAKPQVIQSFTQKPSRPAAPKGVTPAPSGSAPASGGGQQQTTVLQTEQRIKQDFGLTKARTDTKAEQVFKQTTKPPKKEYYVFKKTLKTVDPVNKFKQEAARTRSRARRTKPISGVATLPRQSVSDAFKNLQKPSQDVDKDLAKEMAKDLAKTTRSKQDTVQKTSTDFSRSFKQDITGRKPSYKFKEKVAVPLRLPFLKLKGRADSFAIEIRESGIFKQAATGISSVAKAYKTGRRIVGQKAAASYRIRDLTTGKIVTKGLIEDSTIRRSKKEEGVLIERRGKRIKSGGELKEITLKGIKATRKKSKKIKRY